MIHFSIDVILQHQMSNGHVKILLMRGKMPETPEIASRAKEMNAALTGKMIESIMILQPKSLNLPVDEFCSFLSGATIEEVSHHGKWIKVKTTKGWLLINLGMGGEILLIDGNHLPAKHRATFRFSDATCLSINFWWFGYLHFVKLGDLDNHNMTSRLGPDVLSLSLDQFRFIFSTQKGRARVKQTLLHQSFIAGIGNAYIHDILFLAGLHPNRTLSSLSPQEIDDLFHSINANLIKSLEKGGAFYELNLFGQKGNFLMDDILVGYRETQPCPRCATPIQKIKTGSTSSFICPKCQPDPEE